jgi:hypothetical protein
MNPKQIRSREQVQKVDGKVQVGGTDAVMDINERILNFIMEKNPDLSFAMEESFPMKTTYEGARPLGPILELRAGVPKQIRPQNASTIGVKHPRSCCRTARRRNRRRF